MTTSNNQFSFFPPSRVKIIYFLKGYQVALHWDWKAGLLEIQWGQCLDSDLSWSRACHRQPQGRGQRLTAIIVQREPLKHLGPQLCTGALSFQLDHLPGTVCQADLSQPNVNNFREVAPHKGRGCKRVKKERRFIALGYLSLLKMK